MSKKYELIISDGLPDRGGEIVNPAGWDLRGFRLNPVCMWSHGRGTEDGADVPIGKIHNIRVENKQLLGEVEFNDVTKLAKLAARSVENGTLRGVSCQYITHDWSPLKSGAREIHKAELLEVSLCSIGENPRALVKQPWLTPGQAKQLIEEEILEALHPNRSSASAGEGSIMALQVGSLFISL